MYYPYGTSLKDYRELTPFLIRHKSDLRIASSDINTRVIAVAAVANWQTIPAIQMVIEAVFPASNDSEKQIAECIHEFANEKHGLVLQSKAGGRGHTVYRLVPAHCADQFPPEPDSKAGEL